MKNRIILLIVLGLILVISGCSSASSAEKVIGVNALTADPGAYSGEITVKGVIQFVDTEGFFLKVIDEEEFESCGLTPCAGAGVLPLYLPDASKPFGDTPSKFTYTGDLPALEDYVTIVGSIEKWNGSYFFEVNHMKKGSQTIIARQ